MCWFAREFDAHGSKWKQILQGIKDIYEVVPTNSEIFGQLCAFLELGATFQLHRKSSSGHQAETLEVVLLYEEKQRVYPHKTRQRY